MKKIGIISSNKILSQSLANKIENNPNFDFIPYMLLNIQQAKLDAEILKIDVAVIDMISFNSKGFIRK